MADDASEAQDGAGVESLWLNWVGGISGAFDTASEAGDEEGTRPVQISRRHTIAPSDVMATPRGSLPSGSMFQPLSVRGDIPSPSDLISSGRRRAGGDSPPTVVDERTLAREVQARAGGVALEDRDADAMISRLDKAEYLLENYVASDKSAMMKLLLLFTAIALMFFGTLWTVETNLGSKESTSLLEGYLDKLFFTFQVLATGGFDDSFGEGLSSAFWQALDRLNFTGMLGTGLVVFAVLVGVITTAFESKLEGIAEGRTKVAEENHTLILGW